MVDRLSTSENFVLFVVLKSNHDLAANDVMRLTSLSLAVTERALRKLSSLGLIEVLEEDGRTYYAPRRVAASPL
jgi:predicted transcriptional regulator